MAQDFSRKITICVRRDIPEWQILNAVAHIAAYFGNLIKDDFGTDEHFVTQDDFKMPRNSQYAIVVLEAQKDDLVKLIATAKNKNVEWMGFTQSMIDYLDDNELQKDFSETHSDNVDYLGIGLFGDKDELRDMTKHLKLWK